MERMWSRQSVTLGASQNRQWPDGARTLGTTPNTFVTRHTLEEFWRLRVEETRARYHQAAEHYRMLVQERPDGMPPDPHSALALAHRAESKALDEYTRVLRAFTDLTVNGKIPDEQSPVGSDSL